MSPPPPQDRLARLRGPLPPQQYTARKITALTTNPGCARRAVLDAAGVDKAGLAARLGYQPGFGQSPFAITRGKAFEERVKWGGYAELIRLLRAELDVPVQEATVADLNEVGGNTALQVRARETVRLLRRVAGGDDARLILDHPILTLPVAGQTAYLEPDAVTHRIGGRFYLVEIKSFAAIDGQADPYKVAQAVKQAAVYVLALRHTLAGLGTGPGFGPEAVAEDFLLVCPKDFANTPYGKLVNLTQELDAIAFQLQRLRRAEDLAALLPPTATFDLSRDAEDRPLRSDTELADSLACLEANYTPNCLDFCEMAKYCREEATLLGAPARLGATVRDALPGIGSTDTALKLIGGELEPEPAQSDTVRLLREAARLRALRLAKRGIA